MEKSSHMVTASNDRTASVWDITTVEAVATLTHDLEVNSAVFDPSGMVVVTASQDRSAKLWDATSGEAQGRQNEHQSWMICGSLLDR